MNCHGHQLNLPSSEKPGKDPQFFFMEKIYPHGNQLIQPPDSFRLLAEAGCLEQLLRRRCAVLGYSPPSKKLDTRTRVLGPRTHGLDIA